MGHVLLSCHFNSKHFWLLHLVFEVQMQDFDFRVLFSGGSTQDNFGSTPGPILFIFMQFSEKISQILGWCPLWVCAPGALGKLDYWQRNYSFLLLVFTAKICWY